MSPTEDRLAGLSPAEKRALLAELLRKKAAAAVTVGELSHGQRALWFLHRLAPESTAYNVAYVARIRSRVDVGALQRVFQALVMRHDSLRARFPLRAEGPVREILPLWEVPLDVVDVAGLDDTALDTRVVAAHRRPFDLERGPVLRVSLFTRAVDDYVLLLTVHHIAVDGWSVGLLLEDFRRLYIAETTSAPAGLPTGSAVYADFVAWQTQMLSGPEGAAHRAYWQRQLGGALPVLDLPTDRPRPPSRSLAGGTRHFRLRPELAQAARELCKQERVTAFTLLLAVYHVLLARYSGQHDILVGTPMAGRSRSEFEGVVGYFANPVILRGDLSGDPPFRLFLDRMRRTVLDALSHQDDPFPLLVEALQPTRNPSRTPLFDAAFDLQNFDRIGPMVALLAAGGPGKRADIAGLTLETYDLRQQEGQFDLTLDMYDVDGQIGGLVRFNASLFEEQTIERLIGHYQRLLEGVIANPDEAVSRLPLLTDVERQRLLVEWNATDAEFPHDEPFHRLFESRVAQQPDAPALSFQGETMTYADLNRRANRLARFLGRSGVAPGSLVAVAAERRPETIVAILAVLKAGGAFVPLDLAYPPDRLADMLSDSRAQLLIAASRLPVDFPTAKARVIALDADTSAIDREDDSNLTGGATATDLAYVIYTSGSTGKPKGTLLRHLGWRNLAAAQQRAFGLGPGSRVLQFSSFSFDASIWELAMSLGSGATLCHASRETLSSMPDLQTLLQREAITTATLPPSVIGALYPEALPGLTTLIAAGEACPRVLVQKWAAGRRFFNAYGPTETTVCAAMALCDPTDTRQPPIGRPLDNFKLYVLDAVGQPVPVGVPGELYIGGVGLAVGYLDRPELTAERFVADPFAEQADARLYRTGDRVRRRPDGALEFLGRSDHQVKLRGFRIELGEIEAALRRHAGVREAVVIVREDRPGERRLVAYYLHAADVPLDDLRATLKRSLPDYMVPAALVRLEALPLLPNGKVNTAALPAPEAVGWRPGGPYVAPRTPPEEALARLWSEVLHCERVGVHDNFFELGGHSLLATQIIARTAEAFQVQVPLRSLFEGPTVAEQAVVVEALLMAELDALDDAEAERLLAADGSEQGGQR